MKRARTLLFSLAVAVMMVPLSSPLMAKAPRAAKTGAVNLNSASEKELEALPEVGKATAKKIIAGRPYASVNDLSRAGLSSAAISKISGMVTVSGSVATSAPFAVAPAPVKPVKPVPPVRPAPAAKPAPAAHAPVDVNHASQKDLEALPGIGPATARKIMASRPYASTADLSRAGLSPAAIAKLGGMVTAGSATAPAPSIATTAPVTRPEAGSAPSAAGKLNVNVATEKELEALPGVGPVTAKKIMAGRPFSSVADLSRAGVPPATVSRLSTMVVVGPPAAPAPAPVVPVKAAPAPAARPAPSAPVANPAPAPRPGSGMVWTNPESKVFHREGDRWYGRTKRGQYMSEADALKAGYRASKEKMKATP